MKAKSIINATKPFIFVRALVQLVVTLIMIAAVALAIVLVIALADKSAVVGFALAVIIIGGLFGFLRFAKRYALYMIKAAHVAAITEYIKTGQAPTQVNGYKGVLAYGKDVIQANFGAANIAFVADALIAGASRQIMRWLNKVEKLLSFIPGAEYVFSVINLILYTALNFVDEAVLSYVFYAPDTSAFKKACDGLVYYAQSWKKMFVGAAKVAAFVWVSRVVSFLVFFLIAQIFLSDYFYLSAFIASVITYGLLSVAVEPVATCIMINDYYKAIEGVPVKADLYGTLMKVSGKFKQLWGKVSDSVPSGGAAVSNARFCGSCGGKLEMGSQFCGGCGAPVEKTV